MEVTKTLKSALSTITGQLSKLKEELAETNLQIDAIGAKIQELRGMPLSLEDWSIYLKDLIQKRADSYFPGLAAGLCRSYRGDDPHNQRPWSAFEDDDANPRPLYLTDDIFSPMHLGEAMCFFFPEVIYDRLMTRLKERVGNRWGNDDLPTVQERRKTIAELEAQRSALLEKRGTLEGEIGEISTALRS